MMGAVTMTVSVLPGLLRQQPIPLPPAVVIAASLCQSAVLVGLAVWCGVSLGARLGLHAPVAEAAVKWQGVSRALRAQLLPGLIGAVAAAILLALAVGFTPAEMRAAQERVDAPLAARVIYGGVTEELLLRWGVMTALVWLAWRFIDRRRGLPGRLSVWLAIGASAVLFGIGHLPAAVALMGSLTTGVAAFIVAANTAFGVLFGYLYWRYGLEAAIIAHGLAHLLYAVLTLF